MSQDSFEKQFPDYKIIPSKKSKWLQPTLMIVSVVALAAIVYGLFMQLGRLNAPVANVAGYNSASVGTLKNFALMQSESGQHAEAVRNFAMYFKLGGDDAEVMASYARSLSEIGEKDQAREWASRAVERDPSSKAARFINDSLAR